MPHSHLIRLALALALLPALAAPAHAGPARAPLLTLAYTANSLGEYRACPACGQEALGGLGRRLTVFKELRAAGRESTLMVAGPYEFTPLVQREPRTQDLARALAGAYAMLGYDLGVLAPREREWLAAAGASLPAAWRDLGSGPQTVEFVRGGVKVAMVLFPAESAGRGQAVPKESLRAVLAEALRVRPGADLVAGVSPWGEAGEGELLETAPGAFDLLLGAGRGLGAGVRVASGGRTLWVRPPFDGRGVVLLGILALPGQGGAWAQGRTFTAQVRKLDGMIQDTPSLSALFSVL